jgi:hypothetical protein
LFFQISQKEVLGVNLFEESKKEEKEKTEIKETELEDFDSPSKGGGEEELDFLSHSKSGSILAISDEHFKAANRNNESMVVFDDSDIDEDVDTVKNDNKKIEELFQTEQTSSNSFDFLN